MELWGTPVHTNTLTHTRTNTISLFLSLICRCSAKETGRSTSPLRSSGWAAGCSTQASCPLTQQSTFPHVHQCWTPLCPQLHPHLHLMPLLSQRQRLCPPLQPWLLSCSMLCSRHRFSEDAGVCLLTSAYLYNSNFCYFWYICNNSYTSIL